MNADSTRNDNRRDDEARILDITPDYTMHAPGSVLASSGNTRVICTASVETKVPDFLRKPDGGVRHGWLTAEYGMLPGSTGARKRRDRAKVDGRTQEIQRLIGRSLRSVVDLHALGERTIWIDCDVIQADGGTRTAAITGGFVSLVLALRKIVAAEKMDSLPVKHFLAAISVGMVDERPLLDLNYNEDARASVDMNVVMLETGKFVEVQGTAEGRTFSRTELDTMLDYAELGIRSHIAVEQSILGMSLDGTG